MSFGVPPIVRMPGTTNSLCSSIQCHAYDEEGYNRRAASPHSLQRSNVTGQAKYQCQGCHANLSFITAARHNHTSTPQISHPCAEVARRGAHAQSEACRCEGTERREQAARLRLVDVYWPSVCGLIRRVWWSRNAWSSSAWPGWMTLASSTSTAATASSSPPPSGPTRVSAPLNPQPPLLRSSFGLWLHSVQLPAFSNSVNSGWLQGCACRSDPSPVYFLLLHCTLSRSMLWNLPLRLAWFHSSHQGPSQGPTLINHVSPDQSPRRADGQSTAKLTLLR